MVFDDPNNAKELESETALAKTNTLFQWRILNSSYLNKDVLIVNQQRLHEMIVSLYIANDFDNIGLN